MKWFGITVVALFLVVITAAVGLVVAVLVYPQLLINDHFMIVGSHLADRAGIHVSWDQGHVSVESPALLQKRVHFAFANLCVRIPTSGVDGCFSQAQISAAGGLKGWKPEVSEIGPIDIRGGRLAYTMLPASGPKEEPKPEESEKGEKKDGDLFPKFLAKAKLLPLHIELPSAQFITSGDEDGSGKTTIYGSAELASHVGTAGEAQVQFNANVATLPGKQRAKASFTLENPHGFLALESWRVKGTAQGSLPDGTGVKLRAHVDPRTGAGPLAYSYKLEAGYRKGEQNADVNAVGEVSPDRLMTKISGSARGFVAQLGRIWVKDCDLELKRESSETMPGAFRANCPVFAKVPLPPEGFPNVSLPTDAGVRLTADLKSSAFPPSGDARIDGKVGVDLDPVLSPIFQGEGKVSSQVAGVIKNFPREWKMDTEVGLHLKIARFEQLVKQLANTPFDVWAPLRTMKGSIELGVQGKFDANRGSAPVELRTRLSSAKQKLDLDADGKLTLTRLLPSPRMHLAMDLGLSDVQLQLPPLPELPSTKSPKPDAMPQLFPDGRFQSHVPAKQKAGRAEPPMFSYDVKIHTPAQTPARLLTSQITAPIPLGIDLTLGSDTPMGGQVRVMSFPLQLFKRDVKLDHLSIALGKSSKESDLNGKIDIPYSQYTITILLLGTLDKPQLRFMSDPPLPDTQIISVLIFGQPIDALDPDQQQSVGQSRAALREGAFSLFSLYYLSSMNIEAIDFDPSTHVASIRYKLGEGASLNVSQGTGGGQPSVGVRKRLNKHLAITTTLNNPSERQTKRTVSTFLEWAYQY